MALIDVLFIGHDDHFISKLIKKNLSVVVWSEKKLKKKWATKVRGHFCHHFNLTKLEFQRFFESQFQDIKPTYVIASSEKSVLSAAMAREVFGIQGFNDQNLPYFYDKKEMKQKLHGVVAMTDFHFCRGDESIENLISALGLPLVLKHACSSGSRGLVISSDYQELCQVNLQGMIAEKFIKGREFSVESFLYKGEIIFTNLTEYYFKSHINIAPAQLAPEITKKILGMNAQVLTTLGAYQGMTHLEVYLTEEGLIFGEVALRPPGGFLMELIEQVYSFCPWSAYLDLQMDQKIILPTQPQGYCASIILHPGEGIFDGKQTFDQFSKRPECIQSLLKIGKGDKIEKREGMGQNIGHMIYFDQSRAKLTLALDEMMGENVFSHAQYR
jgi:biotin carboxylase